MSKEEGSPAAGGDQGLTQGGGGGGGRPRGAPRLERPGSGHGDVCRRRQLSSPLERRRRADPDPFLPLLPSPPSLRPSTSSSPPASCCLHAGGGLGAAVAPSRAETPCREKGGGQGAGTARPGLRGPRSALAAEAHRIPTRFSSNTGAQGRAALAGTWGQLCSDVWPHQAPRRGPPKTPAAGAGGRAWLDRGTGSRGAPGGVDAVFGEARSRRVLPPRVISVLMNRHRSRPPAIFTLLGSVSLHVLALPPPPLPSAAQPLAAPSPPSQCEHGPHASISFPCPLGPPGLGRRRGQLPTGTPPPRNVSSVPISWLLPSSPSPAAPAKCLGSSPVPLAKLSVRPAPLSPLPSLQAGHPVVEDAAPPPLSCSSSLSLAGPRPPLAHTRQLQRHHTRPAPPPLSLLRLHSVFNLTLPLQLSQFLHPPRAPSHLCEGAAHSLPPLPPGAASIPTAPRSPASPLARACVCLPCRWASCVHAWLCHPGGSAAKVRASRCCACCPSVSLSPCLGLCRSRAIPAARAQARVRAHGLSFLRSVPTAVCLCPPLFPCLAAAWSRCVPARLHCCSVRPQLPPAQCPASPQPPGQAPKTPVGPDGVGVKAAGHQGRWPWVSADPRGDGYQPGTELQHRAPGLGHTASRSRGCWRGPLGPRGGRGRWLRLAGLTACPVRV